LAYAHKSFCLRPCGCDLKKQFSTFLNHNFLKAQLPNN